MKYSQYRALRNILLEFTGTAAIVYFTNWANILSELKQVQLSSLALVYGLTMSALVYIAQERSGAHFDPSVTLSYLSFNRIDFSAAIPYMLAQMLGGAVSGYIIDKQLSATMQVKLEPIGPLGIPTPEENHILLAFCMETFAVMVIHIVRISVMIDKRGKDNRAFSGLAIGAAYTCFVLASAPMSGACFNPARSLGPLFFMDKIASNSQFIMAMAPFLGCTLGMLIYKQFLISEELEDELEVL